MSDTKFTAGPWLVATSCSWRRILTESGQPVCVPTIQRTDHHPDLHFPNGGEDGPDAHLIAAAPELYEALSASQAELECVYDELRKHQAPKISDPFLRLMNQNRSTLAKARGEQHD